MTTVKPQAPRLTREETFMEALLKVPKIAAIIHNDILFKSSPVFELTESETEYNVKCIKHCFADYLIVQFDCLNTLPEQLLEDVRVSVDTLDLYVLMLRFNKIYFFFQKNEILLKIFLQI